MKTDTVEITIIRKNVGALHLAQSEPRQVEGAEVPVGARGTITAFSFTGARVSILKQWSMEPSVSLNDVRLPAGRFRTTLLRTRSDYGFSPRMFASALLQFSSTDHVFSSNLRFRWEYVPGSELFIVYTDERDTLAPGYPGLKNRAVVVKVNRLFRL